MNLKYTEAKRPARRVVVSESGMFTDEKLNSIKGLQRGLDFVAAPCGCTSRRFGDSTGILEVFTSGLFIITCNCSSQCQQGKSVFIYMFYFLYAISCSSSN